MSFVEYNRFPIFNLVIANIQAMEPFDAYGNLMAQFLRTEDKERIGDPVTYEILEFGCKGGIYQEYGHPARFRYFRLGRITAVIDPNGIDVGHDLQNSLFDMVHQFRTGHASGTVHG
jgi:hypothetical protein